ncbi:unnamed protein product [Nippostrongylus brasiliensis]|uniref:Tetratricopeptide repeat protein 21 homolog (inferred by orthology to a C. elegans protein) n=1 Tax=Nippostrongylus brasiliensis TaxID=27835 RepID=A0A0N4XEH1_NIPBR|nr:unnamed protein product [Nippostrongylus brasiliensis]
MTNCAFVTFPDRQSLLEIESEMSALRDALPSAQLSAAEALFFQKDYSKAKMILDKIMRAAKLIVDELQIVCLYGWTELLLGRDQKSTLEMFERAISSKYLDGYVGKMAVFMSRQLASDMKAVSKVCALVRLFEYFSKFWLINTLLVGPPQRIRAKGKGSIKKSNRAAYLVDEFRVAVSLEDVKEASSKVKQLMTVDSDDPYAALGIALQFWVRNPKRVNPKGNFQNVLEGILQGIPFGVEYLRALDADFLMGIVYQLMDYAPVMPMKSPDETLKTAERLLRIIIDNSPGISQAYFTLARCLFLHSEWDAADRMIEECLQRNETIADAYLLRAEIKSMQGLVADADSCLNTGLSFNFSIRDSTLFHLIKAKVHKQRNEMEKAADLLKAGLKLPQKERSTNLLAKREAADGQRISIQLELIDCLQSMKQPEADRIMIEALEQWKGKPEEQQLLLMNAQLHLSKGDVDGALAVLNTVQPGQSNYHAARIKMAEIYLEEKRDKTMFTVCYRELLKSEPTSATYALLGDAYMSVQEPEKAIEAYENALKMSNKDMALTEKIGEAYVLCHLYSKAVNFYESVMNSTKDKKMRLKLADLLHRLGNTEKCMRILRQPLDEEPNPVDPDTIAAHVQYLKLLAEVQFAGGKHTEALNDLGEYVLQIILFPYFSIFFLFSNFYYIFE